MRITEDEVEYVFCTEYKHYRTGKIMRAKDYGYAFWKFPVRKRKK